jgi:hypothetical protein
MVELYRSFLLLLMLIVKHWLLGDTSTCTVRHVLRGHICTVRHVLRGHICTVRHVLRGHIWDKGKVAL